MGIRAPLVISLLLIAGMAVVSVWAWPLIPDTARIAIHWNADGVANGFASKEKALLIGPLLGAAITAVFAIFPFLTKWRDNLARSASAYIAGWVGLVLAVTVGHFLVILHARGYRVDVLGTHTLAVALVLIVLGNFLGKTFRDSFVGVRTPWTKQSAYAWEKSNRVAGKMMVAVGLASLACLAVDGSRLALHVLIDGMIAMAIVSVALSYVYWKRDPERSSGR